MRKTDKDRAIRKKQKAAAMAVKLNCGHRRRTHLAGAPSGLLTCLDCGEPIKMLSNTVFGSSLDPSAKRNEAHKRHG